MELTKLQKKLSSLLRPFSRPYAFVMRQRRKLYRHKKLYDYRPQCPCIAVGNISLGGTGKTPLTGWLLDWAKENNLSAVVLSRGYGGHQGKAPVVVTPFTPPSIAGDEPLLLARDHPSSTIISFPKRTISARMADKAIRPDIILLDDGMQHLSIQRDADIILFQAEDLGEQWNKVMPSGRWREGEEALTQAACFVIKADAATFEKLEPLARKRLECYKVPFFSFTLTPSKCLPLDRSFFQKPGETSSTSHTLSSTSVDSELLNSQYLLVSGVGNPDQVAVTAKELTGTLPSRHLNFADHYHYRPVDAKKILATAGNLPILCTAKDAVKLEPLLPFFKGHPIFVLHVGVTFGPALFSDGNFPKWWQNWWDSQKEATLS